jgi:hypothetical protein
VAICAAALKVQLVCSFFDFLRCWRFSSGHCFPPYRSTISLVTRFIGENPYTGNAADNAFLGHSDRRSESSEELAKRLGANRPQLQLERADWNFCIVQDARYAARARFASHKKMCRKPNGFRLDQNKSLRANWICREVVDVAVMTPAEEL